MTDTVSDVAPVSLGEQPVPASDEFIKPEEVAVQETEPVKEPEEPTETPVENEKEEEPYPAAEPASKEEPEAVEEQPGKRKLEENSTAEPDLKKMNTGPMEMEQVRA
jgi:hypothetical protein